MRFIAGLVLAVVLALAGLAPARAAAPANQTFQSTISTSCGTFTGCPAGSVLNTTLSPPVLVSIQVSGTFTGTLQFEGSLDCATYTPIPLTPAAGGTPVSSVTGQGIWSGIIINPTCFQVRATAWTSGAATVTMLTVTGASSLSAGAGGGGAITSPLDGNGNVKTAEQNIVTVQPNGGSLNVGGSGTAGAPAGGVLSVQGSVGMTPIQATVTNPQAATPWSYFIVPASALCVSAPCVIKGSAAVFGGVINESTSAQPSGNCTWYDNASAASGNVLYLETTIGAGQIITQPYPGVQTSNGLVVQCAVNPGGSGLLVMFR